MFKLLFKPASPLLGWFILMEILSALILTGYWIHFCSSTPAPWEHGACAGALMTGLFIVSNVLLAWNRLLAVLGFILCWGVMALSLLPAV